jgi:hypothetical protein
MIFFWRASKRGLTVIAYVSAVFMLHALSSCVYIQTYPKHWQAPPESGSPCPTIAGNYENEGETPDGDRIRLHKLLFPSQWTGANYAGVAHIEIEQPDSDAIKVTAWSFMKSLGDITYSKQRDEFVCESGYVSIDKPTHRSDNKFVAGAEWGARRFAKSRDGYLVVQAKGSGVGVFSVIPVAETHTLWYRFRPKLATERDSAR